MCFFFFQAEDGIRDHCVTGVQTCALPILRVPPVLDELGENLLRACPAGGVLLTAGDADFYAAWYMRFARGLRPDLLVRSEERRVGKECRSRWWRYPGSKRIAGGERWHDVR